jgi:hypothetical protein
MRAAHRQWRESRRKKTHPTPDDHPSP